MAEEDHSGLTFFDGVLIAGGGLIAILVAFWVLSAVVGFFWGVVKFAIVVGVIVLLGRMLLRRRS
jgi:hypothetical protein